jgi:hypothetical protein
VNDVESRYEVHITVYRGCFPVIEETTSTRKTKPYIRYPNQGRLVVGESLDPFSPFKVVLIAGACGAKVAQVPVQEGADPTSPENGRRELFRILPPLTNAAPGRHMNPRE